MTNANPIPEERLKELRELAARLPPERVGVSCDQLQAEMDSSYGSSFSDPSAGTTPRTRATATCRCTARGTATPISCPPSARPTTTAEHTRAKAAARGPRAGSAPALLARIWHGGVGLV